MTGPAECAVSIRGLSKRFDTAHVLHDIDLDVAAGHVVVLVGPSGSGKTTLLRSINLLERPTTGRLTVGGTTLSFAPAGPAITRTEAAAIREVRLKTAMVFQAFNLFPHMTALANVAEGLISVKQMAKPAAHVQAMSLLQRMSLVDKANAFPATLSGGQKQRVALARALVSGPRLLAFDEPLGALDALTRIAMQRLLERVWADQTFTAILVTHDVSEAVALADRVLVIEEGRIAEDITVDLARPRQRGSAELAALEGSILGQLLGPGGAG